MGILKKIGDKATDYGGALTSLPSRNRAKYADNGIEAVKYLREWKKEGMPSGERMIDALAMEKKGRKTNGFGAAEAMNKLHDAKGNLGLKKVGTAQEALEEYKKTGRSGRY